MLNPDLRPGIIVRDNRTNFVGLVTEVRKANVFDMVPGKVIGKPIVIVVMENGMTNTYDEKLADHLTPLGY